MFFNVNHPYYSTLIKICHIKNITVFSYTCICHLNPALIFLFMRVLILKIMVREKTDEPN